jgi:hypothetical protein
VKRERIISGLLLAAGLVFALLGQIYLTYRTEFWRDGLLLWGFALVAFVALWRRSRRKGRKRAYRASGPDSPGLGWLIRYPVRTAIALCGVAFVVVAGLNARRMPTMGNFTGLLLLWIAGVVCFLSAFVPTFSIRRVWYQVKGRLGRRRMELISLGALLLAAFLVRAIGLEHIPSNLGGDEGTQGLAAMQLVEPPLSNPFSTGWYSVPTMSFLAYGIAMAIVGPTVAGLRILSALVGTATVLTTFLLARELWGKNVAWLAGAVLACAHYHMHFSRLGSNQIGDGLFATLALWLLVRGVRLRKPILFALSGAVVGLGWYGYFGARLVGIIVALHLAWLFAAEAGSPTATGFLTRYGALVLVLLLAAFVVVAPLLIHYAAYPDTMASRAGQVSVLSNGWLEREKAYTGRTAAAILLRQFGRAFSAFHYTPDPTFWYHPSIPLLDVVSGILLLFGLAWAVARWREHGNVLLVLWFLLAVILGWALTENPPSGQRMVIVAPASALLVALGLEWLSGFVRRTFSRPWLTWGGLAAVLLTLIAGLNLHYYFVVYTPSGVYGNPTAEVATRLGRYLRQEGDDRAVYFYGPPSMYWEIGNLSFLVPNRLGIDVYPPEQGEGLDLAGVGDVHLVFLPHRLAELEAARQQAPGGVEQPFYSEIDGRLLFVLYTLAAQ